MNWTAAVWKNYLTTFFGILAGLPTIVLGSGIVLDPRWAKYLMITAGIGTVGLGVVSKAFNSHSTAEQVQAASEATKTVPPVAGQ